MHIMQDSTITVTTNTNSRYVVKKFATVFRIKRSGKYLSVFLFRSFQEISCLNKVIIFSEKWNYFVDFMLTVKCLFLRMDPLMLQENLQEKPARVILIKIYLKKEFMLKAVPIK